MRVLHISPCPIWDGEERSGMPSIYWGLKGFVDAGHHVMYAYAGKADRQYDIDGIQIHEFALPTALPPRHIWLHRASNKLLALAFLVKGTRRALAISRSFKPDVIYGHFHAAPVAWLVGRVRRIPNITRIFGTFLFPSLHSFVRRWWKLEEVVTFKTPCDLMIITNDGTRGDECARFFGVPDERIKFWINGIRKGMFDPDVDTAAFKASLGIPASHRILVTVSRLVEWKRVDRLIAALPEIVRSHPNATAVIVGDGDARPALESMADRLQVRDHVRFVGSVLHDEVGRYMNAADIFVSLYDFSNVGNPLLEALCCGKCIVSLATGSTGKVISNGETGVILDTASLDRLAGTILDLLQDDRKRRRLGAAARAYAVGSLQTWPERIGTEMQCVEDLVRARAAAGVRTVAHSQ